MEFGKIMFLIGLGITCFVIGFTYGSADGQLIGKEKAKNEYLEIIKNEIVEKQKIELDYMKQTDRDWETSYS